MSFDINQYNFIDELRNLSFIDEIYLYGSRARGDYQSRSDIDLAILCPTANEKDWQKLLAIIEQADTLLEIDCVRYDTINNKEFLKNIDKDKVVIFQRNKHG